jgi:hypothetical protein
VLALAPFFAADGDGVRHIAHYHGAPGVGGLSLVVQPGLAHSWLTRLVPYSGATRWLFLDHSGLVNGVAIGAFAAYAFRYRPEPRKASALLWLVVLAFTSGFFFQYVIWGLPFFLLAGAIRATALMQAALLAPTLLFYLGPWHSDAVVYVYVALMLAIWAGWVAAAASLARRAAVA